MSTHISAYNVRAAAAQTVALSEKIGELADLIPDLVEGGVLARLTRDEAEKVAEVFDLAGYPQAAFEVMEHHEKAAPRERD